MMMTNNRSVIVCLILSCVAGVTLAQTDESRFIEMRDAYLVKYQPLVIQSETAWWDANTTGTDEAFERRKQAQNALVELHSDKTTFYKLRSLRKMDRITDPVLSRELDVMFRLHAPAQADRGTLRKIIDLESEVEKLFNAHRGQVDGKPLSENDIRQILSETKDSCRRKRPGRPIWRSVLRSRQSYVNWWNCGTMLPMNWAFPRISP